jgi:hypothetical protein
VIGKSRSGDGEANCAGHHEQSELEWSFHHLEII